MPAIPLIRLQCGEFLSAPPLTAGCNSYEWGKVGKKSAAARFASATNFQVDDDKPYAELWMGTHPSLPSKDVSTGRSLLDLVEDNEQLLSEAVSKKYKKKLPFLFKVLSISKALSIQAHPNKKLAEQLHAKDPKNYPEMTIAITPFDGLCGFRPLAEIAHFLKTIPPLAELVGSSAVSEFTSTVSGNESHTDKAQIQKNKAALQKAFSALMSTATSSPDKLKAANRDLLTLVEQQGANFAAGGGPGPNSGQELSDLVQRLNSQFPNDIGLFVLFFLNYVTLTAGEAMFLRADDIHAYLSGDIIECMASSDNVVRAGFTPKFKDVDTLKTMLTYNYAPISEQKMKPQDYARVELDRAAHSSGSTCLLYDPPIEEFAVVKTDLGGTGKATFEPIEGPSIIICTQGRGSIGVGGHTQEIREGHVFFVGSTAELVLEAHSEQRFVTFKAFCELPGGGRENL